MVKRDYSKIIVFILSSVAVLTCFNFVPLTRTQNPVAFGSQGSVVPLGANLFVNLAKKIVPSVVNISSLTTVKSPFGQGTQDDILRKFFGDLFKQYNKGGRGGDGGENDDEDDTQIFPPGSRGKQRVPKAMALGTGFSIEPDLILTNNHVVADADADDIKITFTEELDEKPTDAVVVGRDPEIDVALIRIKNKRQMIPVVLGDSDATEVGEYVMAVGNPFGQGHSVTHGIISGKGRLAPDLPLATYIQTDAPINPGNSGGLLVNLKGEVIAINNAIDQRGVGMGFAIPISLVKKILPQLKTKGVVARGYIGVLVDSLTPEIASKLGVSKDLKGPIVSHVYPGEPADKAGLKPYDVILQFNGNPVHSGGDLIAAVTSVEVGDSVPIKVSRAGIEKKFTIRVGKRPGTSQVASQLPPKHDNKEAKINTGMRCRC